MALSVKSGDVVRRDDEAHAATAEFLCDSSAERDLILHSMRSPAANRIRVHQCSSVVEILCAFASSR